MSQPEESRAKTTDTDDLLMRPSGGGPREPDDAIRPPDEELPEEERPHSKANKPGS
jgi:hypothetical protein